MKASSPQGHTCFRLRRAHRRAGFTLVEVMVAGAVGSLVAALTLSVMSEGSRLIRSIASSMLAHNSGSVAIRALTLSLQRAPAGKVQIYPSYVGATGTGGTFGSCLAVTLPDGTSATYYLAPNPRDATLALYLHPTATTAPNPAIDKVLVTSVQDLEFRRDALGAVRAGFRVATYGYPTLTLGRVEADMVRFTTSSLPRN